MKNAIKMFSLLILLSLLISAFVACNEKPGENGDETPEETIDPNATVLDLLKDGQTSFKIAKPATKEKEYVFDAVSDVKRILKENLSLSLDMTFEDNGGNEILVGTLERPEFKELSDKSFRSRDFFVGVMGNKFVIYAESEEGMNTAVRNFEVLIKKKAEKNKSNVKFISTENKECIFKNMTVGGKPLSDFPIIFSQGNTYSQELLAYKLRVALTRATGKTANVYNDKDYRSENLTNAICIGSTKYGEMPKCEGYDYNIELKNGMIFLYSNSIEGYDALLNEFFNALSLGLEDNGNVNSLSGTAPLNEHSKLKNDTSSDIRVIIHNILGNCDTTKYPVPYRTRSVAELLQSYNPDVMGLQECSPNSRAASTNIVTILKEYGYTEVSVNVTNSKKSNYTPLFYNADKLKIVDKGYDYYLGDKNDGGSKSITWAVFEDKETGKRFAACSTHFFYQSDAASDRVENAKMLASRCKNIADKYKCPVIAGGDLNTKPGTDPIKTLTNAGLKHIRDLASNKNNKQTSHAYPEFSKDFGYYNQITPPSNDHTKSIDHVFAYNADTVSFKNYYVVTEEFALMSSDHCPIVVDFSFKK